MKKTKFLLWCVLLLSGFAQAQCNLETFKFGTSISAVMRAIQPNEEKNFVDNNKYDKIVLEIPINKLCNTEKHLQKATVDFVFIFNKLVQFNIRSSSKKPQLIHWAEAIYGKKPNKIKGFYTRQVTEDFIWENDNAVIVYFIEPDGSLISESISIQSKHFEKDFEKYYQIEEAKLSS